MDPRTHVGDGKLPNHYWVFQDRTKFAVKKGVLDVYGKEDTKGAFIGEYKSWCDALAAVDHSYMPHVTIEDRLTGVVFERVCIVCPCCNRETYEDHPDIDFTKEAMQKAGVKFE